MIIRFNSLEYMTVLHAMLKPGIGDKDIQKDTCQKEKRHFEYCFEAFHFLHLLCI
jgi:hypothetical protein